MNEKSLIPAIRFAGFADAWERRKLGDIAVFNPKEDLPNEFEYVDLESVVGIEMLSHRLETKQSAPSRAQRLARKGDLFYQMVRPYQKNNFLFEKDEENYVFSTGYAQIRPSVDGYFVLSLVQGEKFTNTVLDNCTGTSYPAINANDLASIEVYVPTGSKEACVVGHIFRTIDRLITLHQRKHEKLLNIKKSMLEKMFPKNGELIPEVRFAGYTDAWERRKLGNFVESLPSKKYITAPTPDGKIEIIQQGNVPIIGYANGIPCDDYENITVFGDHTVSIYKPHKPFFLATDGTKLLSARSLDGDFFYFLLERYKPIPEGYKRHYTILIERYGCFPCKKEQKQIAILLKHIDTLITLHQRKLEKLQNIKKACLEKMFV